MTIDPHLTRPASATSFVIGTAGHIDHGKTTLVRALTGRNPDRLPEEQRRGMTIDLGFAWTDLPPHGTVGIIDVPGHEAYVRHMLAGASGIDIGLMVIAADDGVMPQTREHAEILDLLGVPGLVCAMTKIDAVEPDLRAMAAADIRSFLAGTPYADAPVVPVSSQTGEGLDELRRALGTALSLFKQPGIFHCQANLVGDRLSHVYLLSAPWSVHIHIVQVDHANHLAVPEHCNPVRNFEKLTKTMGNINDSNVLSL